MIPGFLQPYDPPRSTPEQNRELRELLTARQDNLCARCGRRPRRGLFELGTYMGRLAAICRSCGRQLDAPTRIPKGTATRRLPANRRPPWSPAAAPPRPVVLARSGSLKGLPKRDHADFIAWRDSSGTRGPLHDDCGGQLTRVRGRATLLRCAYCKLVGHAASFLPPVPLDRLTFQAVTPDELLRWAQAPFRRVTRKSNVLRNVNAPGAEPEPHG